MSTVGSTSRILFCPRGSYVGLWSKALSVDGESGGGGGDLYVGGCVCVCMNLYNPMSVWAYVTEIWCRHLKSAEKPSLRVVDSLSPEVFLNFRSVNSCGYQLG